MVTLANSERIAGEILVTGKSTTGQTSFVKVNGETVQIVRSIFSSSVIVTPEGAGAIINLGKAGKIELSPNANLALSFDEKGISGDLTAGRLTVLNSANSVVINTLDGKSATLNAGDSASAVNAQTDTTTDNDGGSAGLIYAVILGGAVVATVLAATTNNNNTTLGGGSTVISPTR
jgi:hypothetical protein